MENNFIQVGEALNSKPCDTKEILRRRSIEIQREKDKIDFKIYSRGTK